MKNDIEFAKKHGRERGRGLRTKALAKKVYIQHIVNKPVIGRASRATVNIALSSRTKQRVLDLETRVAVLEKHIKELEKLRREGS